MCPDSPGAAQTPAPAGTESSAERSDLVAAITPILHRHGLVLEEAAVRMRSGTAEVRVVVDLPEDQLGSADLDTVAAASTDISDMLDAEDSLLGSGPSVLELTTPGIDRALREPRHFRRARGRLVELPARDDAPALRGRVLEVSEDGTEVLLRAEAGRDDRGRPRKFPAGTPAFPTVPLQDAAGARIVIEFDPPEDLSTLLAQARAEATADDHTHRTAPKEN